ncbi:MAG TPA: hypothetical protein VM452_04280, partial [Caulifigura sp.]|nr:hypothetical protein [Caulifigura sp.]
MTRRSWLAAAVALHAAVLVQAADPPKNEAVPAAKKVEATAKITVRDVNLYVMSAYGNSLNNGVLFKSTMPGFMGMRRLTAERKHLNQPSPAGLITFAGEPNSDIDVLLEFKSGKFFGNWPPCPQKSKRLLWVKAKVEKEPAEVVPALPENHWMSFLRKSDRLWFEGGRRSERFIAYDAELPLPTPVKVTLVEGGHGLANTSKFPLLDVTIYKPEDGQWRVGSLARLDAAPKKEEKPAAKEDKEHEKDKKAPSVEAIFDDKAAGPQGENKAEEKKPDDKKTDEKPTETNADPTPAPAA